MYVVLPPLLVPVMMKILPLSSIWQSLDLIPGTSGLVILIFLTLLTKTGSLMPVKINLRSLMGRIFGLQQHSPKLLERSAKPFAPTKKSISGASFIKNSVQSL